MTLREFLARLEKMRDWEEFAAFMMGRRKVLIRAISQALADEAKLLAEVEQLRKTIRQAEQERDAAPLPPGACEPWINTPGDIDALLVRTCDMHSEDAEEQLRKALSQAAGLWLDTICERNSVRAENERLLANLPKRQEAASRQVNALHGKLADLQAENDRLREANSGCTCQSCGELFREDVNVPDDLWNRIRPEGKPEGAGLLCGVCIGKRVAEENERMREALGRWQQIQERCLDVRWYDDHGVGDSQEYVELIEHHIAAPHERRVTRACDMDMALHIAARQQEGRKGDG